MSAWDALARELDSWTAAGRTATFWWRDDDAVTATAALDRLLDLLGRHGIPLGLAVVPGQAVAFALPARVAVLQHGIAHRNQAPAGAKKRELGDRPVDALLAELAASGERLRHLFGSAFLPVLVPPWNRLDPALVPRLSEAGLHALSTYGPRTAAAVRQVNCHGDPIAWHQGRGFAGEGAALGSIVAHLAGRRAGTMDAAEPTGLLTHHLQHDEAVWAFAARFAEVVSHHRAARWLSPAEIFAA